MTMVALLLRGVDAGDISLQSHKVASAFQAGFIEAAVIAADGDEPGDLGLFNRRLQ